VPCLKFYSFIELFGHEPFHKAGCNSKICDNKKLVGMKIATKMMYQKKEEGKWTRRQ
jgi:hypothetical protein